MLKFTAPKTTLTGALVVPALVLALAGCTGSPPSQMPSSEGTSQAPPADPDATETTDEADGAGEEVIAVGLKFEPADLTVPVGTTVRWTNGEAISHTVTSGAWGEVNEDSGLRGTQTADGMFDHALAPMGSDGDTFEFTFDEPGEYQYYCEPHLGMFGTITVE
ncbi:plastocyanin/azurin family copper-binding protein [Lysobacter korlensis]|uniref:Plastocyanin/azurin family copper-binding protein n=1 Tax=Lysobacter korlensis TaxID=553636 RepID=A0ABV6RV42_9GAMM